MDECMFGTGTHLDKDDDPVIHTDQIQFVATLAPVSREYPVAEFLAAKLLRPVLPVASALRPRTTRRQFPGGFAKDSIEDSAYWVHS